MKNHKLIKIKQEKCAKCCSSFQLILHSVLLSYILHNTNTQKLKRDRKHYTSSILLSSQIIFCLNHNLRILILFFRFFAVKQLIKQDHHRRIPLYICILSKQELDQSAL